MTTAIRKPIALLAAAILAVLLAFSGTTPANAAASVGTSMDCQGANCVQGYGALTNVAYDGSFGVIQFECAITANGAVSVAVTSCTADALDAPAIGLPGTAVATAGAGTILTSGAVKICWTGHATFALGGQNVATSGCSLINVGVELPPENIGDLLQGVELNGEYDEA